MATKTTLQSMKSSGANEPSSQLPEIVNVIRQQQQYSIVMANHHQYHQYSVAFLLSSPGLIWEKFLSISATQSLIYLVNSVRLSVCFPLALAFNDWCEIAHCKLAVQWVEVDTVEKSFSFNNISIGSDSSGLGDCLRVAVTVHLLMTWAETE